MGTRGPGWKPSRGGVGLALNQTGGTGEGAHELDLVDLVDRIRLGRYCVPALFKTDLLLLGGVISTSMTLFITGVPLLNQDRLSSNQAAASSRSSFSCFNQGIFFWGGPKQ